MNASLFARSPASLGRLRIVAQPWPYPWLLYDELSTMIAKTSKEPRNLIEDQLFGNPQNADDFFSNHRANKIQINIQNQDQCLHQG